MIYPQTFLLSDDVTPQKLIIAKRTFTIDWDIVTGLKAGFSETSQVRHELAAWVDAKYAIVIQVLNFFHAQMTLFTSLHCQHQLAVALRPSDVSFLGFDWPMADDHVLRKATGWELCAKVLLKPSNLQR